MERNNCNCQPQKVAELSKHNEGQPHRIIWMKLYKVLEN